MDAPDSHPPRHGPRPGPVADRLLADAFPQGAELAGWHLLTEPDRRSAVWRVWLTPTGAPPRRAILKSLSGGEAGDEEAGDGDAYDPDDPTAGPTGAFVRERLALELLTDFTGPPLAPRLLAADVADGALLFDDLLPDDLLAGALPDRTDDPIAATPTLVQPLLEGDPARARAALLGWAELLGRLHGATAPRVAAYRERRARIAPAYHARAAALERGRYDGAVAHWRELLEKAGLDPALRRDADAELDGAWDRLFGDGPWTALIHHDPCPDNVVASAGGTGGAPGELRLIDFEYARFGHALVDAIYLRIPFPSCWCCRGVPDAVRDEAEAIYRAAAAPGLPLAADDVAFARARLDAHAFWTVLGCQMSGYVADEDRTWGVTSVRARIGERLRALADDPLAAESLSALAASAEGLLRYLGEAWGAEAPPLPRYPAFGGPAG